MIKISKQNNSLIVEGIDNVFYPNNGDNSYPLNSLIVVTDNSDMATFRSVATNDVLFSGLIQNITINGEAVTKDNIIQKFDAVSNSSTGGGAVDAYTKEEADNKFATKTELSNVQTVANNADTKVDALTPRVESVETSMNDKQDLLVSGTNIKTINNQSILGEGNIEISDYYTKTEADNKFSTKDELTAVETVANNADTKADAATSRVESVETSLGNKQDTLVSGTNIKTINSQSILGSGDLTISGVSEEQAQEIAKIPTLETELAQKANVSDVPTVQTGEVGTNKNYVYSDGDVDHYNYRAVMSKLDVGINNAENVILSYHLWNSPVTNGVVLPKATTSKAGIITAADKTKLDSIPENIPTQTEVDNIAANVSALETSLGNKQDILVSGTNIKTINNQSILGEGNLEITGGDVDLTNYYTKTETDTKLDTKQNTLVSGTNIKTINGESVLGEGNIEVAKKTDIPSTDNLATKDELTAVETVANNADAKADAATSRIESVETALNNKQDTLVSGTNIKTVNSQSILGEGNIEVSGVSEEQAQEIAKIPTLETELAQKANVSDVPTVQTDGEGTNKNYIYSSPLDTNHAVYSRFTFKPNEKGIKMEADCWGSNHNRTFLFQIPLVTTSENGVMAAADKTKLDSISTEWTGTQSEFDALTTKDNNTIYYVTE